MIIALDADTICIATRAGRLAVRSASTTDELWAVNVGGVRALAACSSSRCLAAGLTSGSIELLDSKTGVGIASLDAHTGPVAALAFSLDARYLMSAGSDGAVRLWDAAGPQLVTTLIQHEGGAASLTALADGRLAVGWDDGRIEILAMPCAR